MQDFYQYGRSKLSFSAGLSCARALWESTADVPVEDNVISETELRTRMQAHGECNPKRLKRDVNAGRREVDWQVTFVLRVLREELAKEKGRRWCGKSEPYSYRQIGVSKRLD